MRGLENRFLHLSKDGTSIMADITYVCNKNYTQKKCLLHLTNYYFRYSQSATLCNCLYFLLIVAFACRLKSYLKHDSDKTKNYIIIHFVSVETKKSKNHLSWSVLCLYTNNSSFFQIYRLADICAKWIILSFKHAEWFLPEYTKHTFLRICCKYPGKRRLINEATVGKILSSKHETFIQCCVNVGPASQTVAQH